MSSYSVNYTERKVYLLRLKYKYEYNINSGKLHSENSLLAVIFLEIHDNRQCIVSINFCDRRIVFVSCKHKKIIKL